MSGTEAINGTKRVGTNAAYGTKKENDLEKFGAGATQYATNTMNCIFDFAQKATGGSAVPDASHNGSMGFEA